jgi:hypothetical protein
VHHSVPIPGLTHLEATAIQVTLAGKPVIVLGAYLSPSRPLIGADLTACIGGGLPILVAGHLNAKHVNWNTRLSTRRGKLLRDYADENSRLIFGPDTRKTQIMLKLTQSLFFLSKTAVSTRALFSVVLEVVCHFSHYSLSQLNWI